VSKASKLPPEIVNHWPEVFDAIEIKSVPIEYINSINVFFNNGKIYTIDVSREKTKYKDSESLETSLETFFQEYDNVIKSIDFSIDTPKVKHDVQKRTRTFLKKGI
jgi:hypothetical protein